MYCLVKSSSNLNCFKINLRTMLLSVLRTGITDRNILHGSCAFICWKRSFSVKLSPNDRDGESEQNIRKYSFAKDLFLGKFDVGIFSTLKMEEITRLEGRIKLLEDYFRTKVNSADIDAKAIIPEKTLTDLKDLNLFGQRIATEYGGLGLNAKEYSCIREITSLDSSIDDLLYSHEAVGLQGILLYGTTAQKRKYLPKLARGECIAAFCLSENDFGSDINSIKTRATLSEDGLMWKLTGNKKWVANGELADLFTVIALTETQDQMGKKGNTYTAFLVERDFGGIEVVKSEQKYGVRGTSLCEVMFKDTPVPVDNVLAEVGLGFQLTINILNSYRFSVGASAAGVLKELIKMSLEFAEEKSLVRENQLAPLGELAEITSMVYALESMTYLTAGLLDHHENTDCVLESALIKVFSFESIWHSMRKCEELFGSNSYSEGFPFERIFRDSRTITVPDEGNDNLKIFIALKGLQCAGFSAQETVQKVRNPYFHPGFVLKKLIESRNDDKDQPKFCLGLNNHVHSSLKTCSDQLEYCVLRLKYVSETLLLRYGQEISRKEAELMRLADIVVYIYAMTAVIGRASYSCTSGLHDSNYEVLLAETFCSNALRKVKSKVKEITDGPWIMGDDGYKKIAKNVFKNKGYFVCSPLARNF